METKKSNTQLKAELDKVKKRLALLQNEDEEDEEEKDEGTENKEEDLKKQISKYKRQIRKKDCEVEDAREEKNKLLKDNLEHIPTIRNLNDRLVIIAETCQDIN